MKITTNKILVIVLAAAVLGALVYAFMPKPVPVDLASVTRGPMQLTVDEDGQTRIKERYVVASPLAGRLLRIELKAGDAVEAGKALLAAIEPADPALLDARTRAEAEARVSGAESKNELARAELERMQKLAAEKVVSNQELDDAETAAKIARFELEQVRAALLRTHVDGGGEAGRFEIHAPISGRILRVLQESAMVVAPGTQLLEIGDPTDLEIVVDVLSTDAVKITHGAKMILEHWGGDKPLLARVRLVEPAGFLKISALGVEEQRVNIIGDFVDAPDKRATLGDAYRVEARIVIWESDDVLRVPAGALFRRGEDWAVFVADGDRAELRAVKIGHNNGSAAEVLEGLTEKTRVILHPSDLIRDGVRISARGGSL